MDKIGLTDAEITAVACAVRDIIRRESKGVSEVDLVDALDGIESFPVIRYEGGIPKIVRVPIQLLSEPAWDAVKELVIRLETAIDNGVTETARVKQYADNPSKIGTNGNWFKWDEVSGAYVDTGVLAKGGILYPTFDIDTNDMCLYMNYQDPIAINMFELDENGILILKIK